MSTQRRKILGAVCGALFAATMLTSWYLPLYFGHTRPKEPTFDHTIPLNNHGTIVFLTPAEDWLLVLNFYGSFATFVFAGFLLKPYWGSWFRTE
jgi:hypothetical protein